MRIDVEKLERIAREHGMTTSSVIRELGMSSSCMTNWRRGISPRASTVTRIADFLGCDSNDLLSDPTMSPARPSTSWTTFEERRLLSIFRRLPEAKRLMMLSHAYRYLSETSAGSGDPDEPQPAEDAS